MGMNQRPSTLSRGVSAVRFMSNAMMVTAVIAIMGPSFYRQMASPRTLMPVNRRNGHGENAHHGVRRAISSGRNGSEEDENIVVGQGATLRMLPTGGAEVVEEGENGVNGQTIVDSGDEHAELLQVLRKFRDAHTAERSYRIDVDENEDGVPAHTDRVLDRVEGVDPTDNRVKAAKRPFNDKRAADFPRGRLLTDEGRFAAATHSPHLRNVRGSVLSGHRRRRMQMQESTDVRLWDNDEGLNNLGSEPTMAEAEERDLSISAETLLGDDFKPVHDLAKLHAKYRTMVRDIEHRLPDEERSLRGWAVSAHRLIIDNAELLSLESLMTGLNGALTGTQMEIENALIHCLSQITPDKIFRFLLDERERLFNPEEPNSGLISEISKVVSQYGR